MTARCLILIDLLNDYLDRWDQDRADLLIGSANRLSWAFRRAGHPVVWVRQEFSADLSDAFLEMRDRGIAVTIAGTRGARLHAGLDQRPGDFEIVKTRYSAFFRTGLDALLSRTGAGEICLCGINTHACIRTTAIDAYQRDLRVVIPADGVGSYDEEHARVSLAYMDGRIATLTKVTDIVASLGTG